jgi:ParB-like chromosome segregation protein Spo0J
MAREQNLSLASFRPGLSVVWRSIEELKPDPRPPRFYSREQIRQLAKTITSFGFTVPILIDRELRITAGRGRLLGARELGWKRVPTILLDDLSPAQAQVFMVADDQRAGTTSWDDLLLAMQLKELSTA